MSKLHTIKKSIIFKKVYKNGLTIRSDGFVLRFLQNNKHNFNTNTQDILFGFILSKKVGTSVKRNYIKRRLKSAISSCLNDFNIKGYYVFIAESRLGSISYSNIILNIRSTLKFLHKIINKNACNN